MAEACRQRGIDRTSFYEWKRRFQTQDCEDLKDLPPIQNRTRRPPRPRRCKRSGAGAWPVSGGFAAAPCGMAGRVRVTGSRDVGLRLGFRHACDTDAGLARKQSFIMLEFLPWGARRALSQLTPARRRNGLAATGTARKRKASTPSQRHRCHLDGQPESGLKLEGNGHPRAEGGHLAILDLHVQFHDLGHAKVAERA